MQTWRWTLHLASQILLPPHGPLVLDAALAAMQVPATRQPGDPDWQPEIALPLAWDPETGVWAISAVQFPDPGVWVPNLGYRSDPNQFYLGHSAPLYRTKDVSSGPFRAGSYALSGWIAPRVQVLTTVTDADQLTALARLMRRFTATGLGRKRAVGYGRVVRVADPEPVDDPSAVWDPGTGLPRRLVPVDRVARPLAAPRGYWSITFPRWVGAAVLCYLRDPATWKPPVWQRPAPAADADTPEEEESHG